MANVDNLKPFSSENQPAVRGRTKGSPNRATVLKKWLKVKIEIDDPANEGEKLRVSMQDAMALGQIAAAADGNTAAFKEIQDTVFGKVAEKIEHSGNVGFNWSDISNDAKNTPNLTDENA